MSRIMVRACVFVAVAALAGSLVTAVAAADGGISFDGSPGTGAPPPTLGGYVMRPFGTDRRPLGQSVTGVTDPVGTIKFSPAVDHTRVGSGWQTWSNGYTGDVYAAAGESA